MDGNINQPNITPEPTNFEPTPPSLQPAPTPNPTVPNFSSQNSSQPVKRRSLVPIILLVGVVLLLAGVLGYKYLQSQTAKPRSQAEVIKEQNQKASKSEYGLADKPTTFGGTSKINITLPKGWSIVTGDIPSEPTLEATASRDAKYPNVLFEPTIFIVLDTDISNIPGNFYLNNLVSFQETNFEKTDLISKKDVTISGLKGVQLEYTKVNTLGQKTTDTAKKYDHVIWTVLQTGKTFFGIEMKSDDTMKADIIPLFNKVLDSITT
ncbi:MAG: hypothetical protein WCO19_03710 [Candidatus Saccharibacteria bacterium]